MGSATTPADSSLAVFDLHTNKRVAYVATGLHDVVGVAVSPRTNRIYAVDFASAATDQGGLFRLDLVTEDGETVCKTTRLMPLDRPSALAFAPDGTLFITTWGSLSEAHQEGCLVRIYEDSQL
jgi:glucose/arabinose dehydrogenase